MLKNLYGQQKHNNEFNNYSDNKNQYSTPHHYFAFNPNANKNNRKLSSINTIKMNDSKNGDDFYISIQNQQSE